MAKAYLEILRKILEDKIPFDSNEIDGLLEKSGAKSVDLSKEGNRSAVYADIADYAKAFMGPKGAEWLITEIRCNFFIYRKITESMSNALASKLYKNLVVYDFRDKEHLELSILKISKVLDKSLGKKLSVDLSKEILLGLKERLKY